MEETQRPKIIERKIQLMKEGHANSVVFVIGARGSGKTQLMADILKARERFVIFDTRKDYDETFMAAVVVTSPDGLLKALYNRSTQRVIFRLSVMDKKSFDAAMKVVYLFQEKNSEKLSPLAISVDELNRFADTNEWGEHFETIITSGRDYKIDCVFGCQWFGTIPGAVRDTATEVYAFRTLDPSSVDRLCIFGFFADDLRTLPQYHVLYYKGNEIKIVNVIGQKPK